MILTREVTDLLLISKAIIDTVRFQLGGAPDRHSLALRILAAHDAAELCLSAIGNARGKMPNKSQRFLMDYFEPLKTLHPRSEVAGKEYFNQLNRVRVAIKHHGIFPDARQWDTVGENVYKYMSKWCAKYLSVNLEDLDESVLLENVKAKANYIEAKQCVEQQSYKGALENIALALHIILDTNPAVRGLMVGSAHAEDAIKLATFGVQANDFLTLQNFLPKIFSSGEERGAHWDQEQFGHPGNWNRETCLFCLKAFLDVALKIQHAPKIPGPTKFGDVYEYKITALKDRTEIRNFPESPYGIDKHKILKTLSRGESIRGIVTVLKSDPLFESIVLGIPPRKTELKIESTSEHLNGFVKEEDVHVTCVPKQNTYVKSSFPDLPEINWQKGRMFDLIRTRFKDSEDSAD
ncbi:MAG TPA: hypothetical protein VGH16_02785 [Candidatus Binatia bacterium]|jgi:hypothetical protein